MTNTMNTDAGPPANACIACPTSLGELCEQSDVTTYPAYEQVRAELLAGCATRSAVTEGSCADSGLRFLHISYGLGSKRQYFDADGKFVALTTQVDLLDETCRGKKHWPVQVQCDDKTEVKALCDATSP